jgi:DNA-binding response OmpR family regulator
MLARLVLNVVQRTTISWSTVVAHTYRILFAGDEPLLGLFLGRLIRQCYPAATLRIISDGLVALCEYEHDGADLLIASHGLRGMHGSRFIGAVRARQAKVPILAISGDPINEAELCRAGASAFLNTPFTIVAFRHTVCGLLPP